MHAKHVVFGVHVTDRLRRAGDVQEILTEFGDHIKTRLGLHHVDENVCSPRGLILLEMHGDETQCQAMADRLAALDGVEVQKMVFDHPAP